MLESLYLLEDSMIEIMCFKGVIELDFCIGFISFL